MKVLLRAAMALGVLGAAISPSHAVVVGTADTSSNVPFDNAYSTYFQQVYSGLGAMNIHSLTFYNSQYPGGTPATGQFTLYLSYVSSLTDIAKFDTNNVTYPDSSFVTVYS